MKFYTLSINLIFGLLLSAQPSIKEILDSPFASNLTVSKDGKAIAWVDNIAGERNIFIATGEQFSSVYKLTEYVGDQGISISNLEFTPDGNRLVYVRGNTKGSLGDHEEAIKDYKKTIQLQPKHINAYGNLALAQKDLGFYQEAIRTFDKALSIDPRHSNNFRMRGNIKYELKKYKEAIIDFDKALSIPSKVADDKAWREGVHADAYYDRAYAYVGLEKYEAACKDFEKAKSLGKNLSEQIVNACNLK